MSDINSWKLYLVELQGFKYSTTSVCYKQSYVVAQDPEEAYRQVRDFLDERSLGVKSDRELKSVTLLAECIRYPESHNLLYLGSGSIK